MKYEEPDHTLTLPPQDKISKHEIDLLFLDKLGVLLQLVQKNEHISQNDAERSHFDNPFASNT